MKSQNSSLKLSKKLVSTLKKYKLTLATAESCTGGLLSSVITQHAGVSEVFLGGVVSYSNASKTKLLGVRSNTIQKYGAVSLPVAAQMSIGTYKKFSSDIAISITGIAGPTGGTKLKPVGTVCFAVHSGMETILQQMHFAGTRVQIQNLAAKHALELLLEVVGGVRFSV